MPTCSRALESTRRGLHNLVRFDGAGGTVKQAYGTSCVLTTLADGALHLRIGRMTPNYRVDAG